eukprot:scaffold14470_cov107-Isochrysis_galbana.AAC.6
MAHRVGVGGLALLPLSSPWCVFPLATAPPAWVLPKKPTAASPNSKPGIPPGHIRLGPAVRTTCASWGTCPPPHATAGSRGRPHRPPPGGRRRATACRTDGWPTHCVLWRQTHRRQPRTAVAVQAATSSPALCSCAAGVGRHKALPAPRPACAGNRSDTAAAVGLVARLQPVEAAPERCRPSLPSERLPSRSHLQVTLADARRCHRRTARARESSAPPLAKPPAARRPIGPRSACLIRSGPACTGRASEAAARPCAPVDARRGHLHRRRRGGRAAQEDSLGAGRRSGWPRRKSQPPR